VIQMKTGAKRIGSYSLGLFAAVAAGGVSAETDAWQEEVIHDALLAAPPGVTETATVLGWTSDGELEVARYGSGPYTCIASGSFSLRLGKPALPYPDPMCLDQNAWSFLQAVWAKAAGDDQAAMPTAPGLIWMLAGMNVSKDAVDVGAAAVEVAQGSSEMPDADVVQMTPHIMIMPLPFDEAVAGMTTSYNLEDPLAAWIMASGQPHEHLMVHMSPDDVNAMMGSAE
jgi:hypothetical protein